MRLVPREKQMAETTIPWWRRALEYALSGLRSGFGFFPHPASPQPVTVPNTSGSFTDHAEDDRALKEPSPKVIAVPMNAAEPASIAQPAKVTEKSRVVSKRAAQPASEATAAPLPAAGSEVVVESDMVPVLLAEGALDTDSKPTATEMAEAHAVSEVVKEPCIEAEPVVEAVVVNEAIPEAIEAAVPEREAVPETAAALEAVIEALPEPVIELEAVIANEPVEEQGSADEPEPVAEHVSAPAIAPAAEAAAPPLQAAPEPAPEPVAVPVPAAVAVPRRVLKPQPSEEDKAAARKAARQKKLDEGSEESPFSVIVGQVYDGPMDLLLDLIRKQDIDIYDIPIAIITSQFLAYVNQLRASDVDVAGDFIYTASLLIHIKSKMLLPHSDTGPEQAAEDPRRELVERLLEHERFKNAAQMLLEKQMLEAASWSNPGAREFKDDEAAEPEIAADTVDLVRIFREILERARNRPVIDVEEDSVTVGQMIQFLARRLTLEDKPVALRRLLSHTHSERALIAMFLALLEMVRLQAILLRQDRQFSEIFIKKSTCFETVMNEGLGAARDDWR